MLLRSLRLVLVVLGALSCAPTALALNLQPYTQQAFGAAYGGQAIALPGALVTIYLYGTSTKANLYAISGGVCSSGTPLSNPMTADANGLVNFCADSGSQYQANWSLGTYVSPTIYFTTNIPPAYGQNNTWTGANTFSGGLYVQGSGSGTTQINSLNSGSTNYVVNLPAANDTYALLAAVQTLTNKSINFANNTASNLPYTAIAAINANSLLGNNTGSSTNPVQVSIASGNWSPLSTAPNTSGGFPILSGAPVQDYVLMGGASSTNLYVSVPNCFNALNYSTTTHAWSCNTLAGTGTVTQVNAGQGLSAGGYGSSGGNVTSSGTLTAIQQVQAFTTTTPSVTSTYCSYLVNFSNSAAVSASLSGGVAANCYIDFQNINTGLVTITPSSGNIDGNATAIIPNGYGFRLTSDGTNWHMSGFNPLRGRVLLATYTPSGVATQSDTSSLTSAYSEYEIDIENFVPSITSVYLNMEVQTGGSFQTSNYAYDVCNSGGCSGNTGQAYMVPGYASISTASGSGITCRFQVSNPAGTSTLKHFTGLCSSASSTTISQVYFGGAWTGGNGAITGIQFTFGTGSTYNTANISLGTMKIYGWN